MTAIVVGVDGSPGSLEAMAWAVGEARLRGEELRAVWAWSFPAYAYSGYIAVPAVEPYEQASKEALDKTMADAAATLDLSGVTVTSELVHGSPAEVLIEASANASLVVVGSRGHGGFTGLLLGSVSQAVAAHAHCPVIIIPGSKHERRSHR